VGINVIFLSTVPTVHLVNSARVRHISIPSDSHRSYGSPARLMEGTVTAPGTYPTGVGVMGGTGGAPILRDNAVHAPTASTMRTSKTTP
jgi:hypothetical protein